MLNYHKYSPDRNREKINISVTLVILSCILFFCHYQYAEAYSTITWDFTSGHSTNDGGVNALDPRVFFTVHDSALTGNGHIDTINVLVNSTSDQAGITLTLTEDPSDNGNFTNTNLIFTNGPSQFHLTDVVNVKLNDTSGNLSPTVIDHVPDPSGPLASGLIIFSTTDNSVGIPFFLNETGVNTGIFTNPLHFSTGPSVANKTIQANPGDIVSIINQDTGQFQNWLIVPNPDPALGALPANEGDKVTAIYNGVKAQTVLDAASGAGGGGGGLIRPSLVLDILAAIVGGSPYVVAPPSFGGSYYHFSDGLTLNQGDSGNKETFDISKYNAEVPKQVMVPGETAHMTFKTFEDYNPDGVIGMTLYFIPRGQDLDMDVSKSIADIEWKKGKPIEIDDQNHILSNVNASSNTDGKFQYTKFVFVPTKSYDKMSFIVRAWNDHLYTMETRVHDGTDTPAPVKTLPAGIIQYNNFDDLYSALEKDGYPKPSVLSHIHDTNSVFGSSDAGKVSWLYDTTNKTVTLVISDKDGNELGRTTSSLDPLTVEKKGDYGFMHFTTKQLNGWNEDDMKRMMGIESSKAMFSALEKGIMPHRNW